MSQRRLKVRNILKKISKARNQYLSSIATVEAAVDNRKMLRDYQKRFFDSSLKEFKDEKIKAYEFGDLYDQNRNKAFIDKLLIHKVKVYKSKGKFVVPVNQKLVNIYSMLESSLVIQHR